MPNVVLDSSLWEETTSDQALDFDKPVAADELEAARGIFWWGLASVLLWGLITLLIV